MAGTGAALNKSSAPTQHLSVRNDDERKGLVLISAPFLYALILLAVPVLSVVEALEAVRGTPEELTVSEKELAAEARYFDLSYYHFDVPGFNAPVQFHKIFYRAHPWGSWWH